MQQASQASSFPAQWPSEEDLPSHEERLPLSDASRRRRGSPGDLKSLMGRRAGRRWSGKILAAACMGFALGAVSILAIIEAGPKSIAMRHMIPYTDWQTGHADAEAVHKTRESLTGRSRSSDKWGGAWRRCKEAHDLQCHTRHGRMYAVSTVRETWDAAEARCQDLGDDSHLVSIHDDAEGQYVSSKVKAAEAFWIGLRFDGGDWVWTNGKPLTFESWSGDGHRPQSQEELNGDKGPRLCASSSTSASKAHHHHHHSTQHNVWENTYCSEHKQIFVCRWTG